MLRMFLRRTPSVQCLETSGLIPVFSSVTGGAPLPLQLSRSPPILSCKAGTECRYFSSSLSERNKREIRGRWKSGLLGGTGNSVTLDRERNWLSPCVTPLNRKLSVTSVNSYWGKEGRPGYRRKRRIERDHREQILNPSSPVIDQRVPWPKDDFESLPPDLFKENLDELSPEETRDSQNTVLNSINSQITSHAEGRLFAVVHVCGKQFKITPEDIIIVQEYFPPTVGDQIRLHKVLLVGGKDFTLLGSPILDSDLVRIEATVIEKSLSYTKFHFKMIKRAQYRRMNFYKSTYTMLRINLIEFMQPLDLIKSESVTASHLYTTA